MTDDSASLRSRIEVLERRVSELSWAAVRIGAILDPDAVPQEVVDSARVMTRAVRPSAWVVLDAGTGGVVSLNGEARRIVEGLRGEDGSVERLVELMTCRRERGRPEGFSSRTAASPRRDGPGRGDRALGARRAERASDLACSTVTSAASLRRPTRCHPQRVARSHEAQIAHVLEVAVGPRPGSQQTPQRRVGMPGGVHAFRRLRRRAVVQRALRL